eukprot:CFRG2194T1
MGVNGSKIEQALGPAFPPNERYFGLENYGNTCYCNSILQALYFCPPFRQRLLHYQHNLNEKMKKGMPRPKENLLLSLAELFSHISSQKKRSGKVEPRAFVNRLRLDNVLFSGYLQQDAHEFFNFLLNKVAELLAEENRLLRESENEGVDLDGNENGQENVNEYDDGNEDENIGTTVTVCGVADSGSGSGSGGLSNFIPNLKRMSQGLRQSTSPALKHASTTPYTTQAHDQAQAQPVFLSFTSPTDTHPSNSTKMDRTATYTTPLGNSEEKKGKIRGVPSRNRGEKDIKDREGKDEKDEKRSSSSVKTSKSKGEGTKPTQNGIAGVWNSAKARVRSKSIPDVVDMKKFTEEHGKVSIEGETTKTKTWIQDIFEGVLTNETRCLECETVSSKDECFLDLSVDIEQNSSITRCLRNFSTTEYLRAEHKYFCETCCSLQEAEKRMRIKRSPQILALHLKRFKYVESLGRYKKLSYRVVFPLELKLFNMSDDAESPDQMYDLFAVVIHVGSGPNQGHYITIVKSHDNWLVFDDDNIEVVEESKLQSFFGLCGDRSDGGQSSESGYILFYHERGVVVTERRHMQSVPVMKCGESLPTAV